MYFVSVLCLTNLALWLQETNNTYLLKLTYLLYTTLDSCITYTYAA